jgi:hypothetical protein
MSLFDILAKKSHLKQKKTPAHTSPIEVCAGNLALSYFVTHGLPIARRH